MATATATAQSLAHLLAARTKEDRLNVALPVKLFVDANSTTAEWTCTYEISSKSARLRRTANIKTVGQELWLQRNNRRAKFRVTWIGEQESSQAYQVGVDCLEDRPIWDDDLQGRLRR